MKLFCISLFCSMAMSGSAFAEKQTGPSVVRIEGMSEMLSLLKRIDQGVARLVASRWEYRMVQRNRFTDNLDEQIAALGRDGWELVTATPQEGFILKRRLPR